MTNDEPGAHASRQVLLMVSELHIRGYQRLRILPYMSASGTAWRCAIAPASLFSPNGLHVDQSGGFGVTTVSYSSASGVEYFNWTDAQYATPSGLARLFLQRFPQIAGAAQDSDWTYAGWYVEMLGLTYPDRLPYAFADWDGAEERANTTTWRTITMGGANEHGADIRIPLPPVKN